MTKEELAARLNGREVGDEITREEAFEAEKAGIVVVYGASDDLMEFDGAICDEVSCYDGGTAFLDANGLLQNECDDENCPHFIRMKEKAIIIKAIWDDDKFPTWSYKTDIPHSTFDILEEGDVFCRGIVFAVSDIQ